MNHLAYKIDKPEICPLIRLRRKTAAMLIDFIFIFSINEEFFFLRLEFLMKNKEFLNCYL